MDWFIKAMKQYADFNGRARRREFWMFLFVYLLIISGAAIIDNLLEITYGGMFFIGPLYSISAVIMLIPSIALVTRRLHDVDKSGWMMLIALIPFVGHVWLLVLQLTEGTPNENQYGENPKAVLA
jgi:uncharacterized membrane protein YhaH (DUF805 family)